MEQYSILILLFISRPASLLNCKYDQTKTDYLDDPDFHANENSMPFVVSIEKTITKSCTHNNMCTGMFVSANWVTTSCTCLLEMNREDGQFTEPPSILFKLSGGATNRSSGFAQIRFGIRIVYHTYCNPKLKTMDVALIRANYPFNKNSLVTFPVASHLVEFLERGLDTFIRRQLKCGVFGWPWDPHRHFVALNEMSVDLMKDEECGEIACSYAPGLCKGNETRTTNSKGIGFVCAKAVNSYPPCTGFEGAPLVCGTNVWATVTAVKPCNESNFNGTILMTRLEVLYDFIKSSSTIPSTPLLYLIILIQMFKYTLEE